MGLRFMVTCVLKDLNTLYLLKAFAVFNNAPFSFKGPTLLLYCQICIQETWMTECLICLFVCLFFFFHFFDSENRAESKKIPIWKPRAFTFGISSIQLISCFTRDISTLSDELLPLLTLSYCHEMSGLQAMNNFTPSNDNLSRTAVF